MTASGEKGTDLFITAKDDLQILKIPPNFTKLHNEGGGRLQ